jgi:hypothetical protein
MVSTIGRGGETTTWVIGGVVTEDKDDEGLAGIE